MAAEDWPTIAAATRRHPLSTKTSCRPRRRASSAPTWTATHSRRSARTIPATTCELAGRRHRPRHSRPVRPLRESALSDADATPHLADRRRATRPRSRAHWQRRRARGRARRAGRVLACRQHPDHRRRAVHRRRRPRPSEADAADRRCRRRRSRRGGPPRPRCAARWWPGSASCSSSTRHDLATLVTIEAGKITSEALGEVQEMIDICQFAVGLSRQLYGRTIASERPGHRLMETWHPLGVVGVITAFNFPVAVWAWNTAVALVCGDTVVWKPSELTPADRARLPGPDRAGRRRRRCAARAEPARPGRPRARRAAGRRPAGRAAVSATGSVRMGQQVGPRVARALRPVAAGTGRQQRGDRDAVGRSRPGRARHRVRRGRHRRAALHHAAPADRAPLGRRRAGRTRIAAAVPAAARRRPVGADGTLVGPLIHETAYRDMVGALEQARADGGEVVGGERQSIVGDQGRLLRRTRRRADAGADRDRARRDVRARSSTC